MRLTVWAPSVRHLLDDAELPSDLRLDVLFEEQLGASQNGGQNVVEVVGDPSGHFSQGPKPLCLYDPLLRRLELVQGRA